MNGESNHRKRTTIISIFFILLIAAGIAIGIYLSNRDRDYRLSVNLDFQFTVDSALDNVQCSIEIKNIEDEYGNDYATDYTYSTMTTAGDNLLLKDVNFKDVNRKTTGADLDDIIIYVNIKNCEDVPIALNSTIGTSNDDNLSCYAEQLDYIQEKSSTATIDDVKTQTAVFKITYTNDDILKNFKEVVALKLSIKKLELIADTPASQFDCEFDSVNKTVVINSFSGTGSVVKIPRTITHNGVEYEVTTLGSELFKGNNTITKVYLPDTLVEIGDSAFQSTTKLEYVFIPNGVERIGDRAFQSSAIESIVLPKNLTQLNFGIFQQCKQLSNLTLPENLEFIGNSALNHCESLKIDVLRLPKTLKQIGGRTYDPDNPDTEIIGTMIFYNFSTSTLARFEIDASNQYFVTIDGVLYRRGADGKPSVLIAYPSMKTDEVYEMPDSVVDAFELSLSRPYNLKEFKIGNGFIVKEMDDSHVNKIEMNNLTGAIYQYNGVTRITCKDDNPNYMTANGQLYSKDGKILYAASRLSNIHSNSADTETLTFLAGVETFYMGSIRGATYINASLTPDENCWRKAYTSIIIPQSVKTIYTYVGTDDHKIEDVLEIINKNYSNNITLETGNTAFQIVSGKLEKI